MENKNAKPKSIGGVSFNEEQQNLNYQQNYYNQENQIHNSNNTKKESNKMTVWCIALAVLVVVLLIVLIIVLVKRTDDSKDIKDEKTIEESSEEIEEDFSQEDESSDELTEDIITEEVVENDSDMTYEYIQPTAFSGNWEDFQVSINDVMYQFPFPYYVLEQNGWEADYEPTEVPSAGTEWLMYKSPVSGDYFYFFVFNPQSTAQPLENCMVTGFTVDSGCKEDVIKFSDSLVFNSSVKDDFLVEFGSPDLVYDDDDGSQRLNYETDDYDGFTDFVFDKNNVCFDVYMENQKMPEEISQNIEISAEAPSINSDYEPPSGPAKDGLDPVVTIDGVDYMLPCPVSEFTKNGWKVESMSDDYIYAESSIYSAFEKDGEKFFCEIENFTSDTIFTYNGMVTMIDVEVGYLDEIDIVFPGGIEIGDNSTDFETVYSDLESYEKDVEEDGDIYYFVYEPINDGYVYISVFCDEATDGIISSYSFCNDK